MARKEAMQEREINIARVDWYHGGEYTKPLVFVSDRPSEATYDYHLKEDNSLPAMYGIEVETQNWGIKEQTIYANVLKHICFSTFHKDLWKIERDGSLEGNCDSFAECITQPMTKAYIRNHYRDFKAMWKYFKEFGISCDKTGDCGMHVHISNTCFGRTDKTQEEAIRKFLYIVNKHYDLMVRLVYRNPSVTGYCPQMRKLTKKEYAQSVNLQYFDNDHYVCINMGHYMEGNIELRLVGGQKNYACFRNTMECVFHLVEACKRISWNDCDSIVRIFKGCNQYVFDRLATMVLDAGQITTTELEAIKATIKTENLL